MHFGVSMCFFTSSYTSGLSCRMSFLLSKVYCFVYYGFVGNALDFCLAFLPETIPRACPTLLLGALRPAAVFRPVSCCSGLGRCVGTEAAFHIMLRIQCVSRMHQSVDWSFPIPENWLLSPFLYCSVPSLLGTWMWDLFSVLIPLSFSCFSLFSTFCPHSPFCIIPSNPTSKSLISSVAASRPLSNQLSS